MLERKKPGISMDGTGWMMAGCIEIEKSWKKSEWYF